MTAATTGASEESIFQQGKVFSSDDGGTTWLHRADYSFIEAKTFVAGDHLYALGNYGGEGRGDMAVMRSDDWGKSWTEPVVLFPGLRWHLTPCNTVYANECVYFAVEKRCSEDVEGWAVSILSPILMRAKVDSDMLLEESWTLSSELVFRDNVDMDEIDFTGIPFFPFVPDGPNWIHKWDCVMVPPGWLETNVVQIRDPNHYWHDPKGGTFHLFIRAHTGRSNFAAIAKVCENDDGSMTTMLVTVPSGKKMVYLPLPGGHLKFFIEYDAVSNLYWMASNQATDSMVRADCMPADRHASPDNERHRLGLHFSRNCVDWCFAGLVAKGNSEKEARHYPSMTIDGDNLVVLSRSGDERAQSAHDGNMISCHVVRDFRKLVY
ncbi:MAG: glycoside hydrolase [Lentisphaeria bacterium]|nr:glycoside hydrolase [Lentisphaeria bacterium]